MINIEALDLEFTYVICAVHVRSSKSKSNVFKSWLIEKEILSHSKFIPLRVNRSLYTFDEC